jgi:ferric-dicitrate binding protein FerR (iron transport regulator)
METQPLPSEYLEIDLQAAAWFSRWRSGAMSEMESSALQSWLAQNERHRAAYEWLESLWMQMEQARALPRILKLREQAAGSVPVRGVAASVGAAATVAAVVATGFIPSLRDDLVGTTRATGYAVGVQPGKTDASGRGYVVLEFDEERLDSIAAELNRYSKKKVIIRDPLVGARRLSAVLIAGDVEAFAQSTQRLGLASIRYEDASRIELAPY